MEKLENILIGFLLVGLFITAFYSFSIGIANNYDYDDSLMENEHIDYSSIEEKLESTQNDSASWFNSFRKDKPKIFYGGLVFVSVWGVIQNLASTTIGLWDILSDIIFNVFGIDPIVLGIIGSIIFIVLISLGWKKIKLGT